MENKQGARFSMVDADYLPEGFAGQQKIYITGLGALVNWFVSRHDGLSLPPSGRINNFFGNKIPRRMVLLNDSTN
jgi:hypothetical protein